jgi:uncharacterized protein (DUF362 family)
MPSEARDGGAGSASPAGVTTGQAAGQGAGHVVDAEKLRARQRAHLAARSDVTIVKGGTPRELGERLCREVMPPRPPETPVILKPNLGGFDWFKDPKTHDGDDGIKGRITDPEFVRGVIACLKARGHMRIAVVEGWGATHQDWEHLVRQSGYAAMAAEENVPLVALDDDGVFDKSTGAWPDAPGLPLAVRGMEETHVPTLLVPKLLAETLEEGPSRGLFVSLPKIKAHRFGVFSMAIKGTQGTIDLSDATPAFRQKWRMHRELGKLLGKDGHMKDDRAAYVSALETFAERIADVLSVEAADVVLAEGAPAMGGDGFQKLYPSAEKFAIGGTNPILVDRVGAEMLGLFANAALARELGGHATSPLLEVAAQRFGIDLGVPPAVRGDGADLLTAAKARPVHFDAMAGFSLHGTNTAAPDEARPVVHAARIEPDRIHVDGRADDDAWRAAPRARFDTDYAGKPTKIPTSVAFAYSTEGLYALFELDAAGLEVDTTQPTTVERKGLYREDCVELFLTPDPARRSHYFEVELGPLGHYFDIDVDRTQKLEDIAWSSGARIGTTHDAAQHTATIEVLLAAPAVAAALHPGAHLPLGIFRVEGKPQTFLAWSPPRTKAPNFHVPDAFGTLVLDP